MKINHMLAHMRAARAYAQSSHAVRRKVGAVLVKHNSPIASGWNGTPSGHHNCCESECGTKTLDSVIHAEVNTYRKLLKLYETSHNTQLFVTCLPCKNCAEYIITQTDTREIYFAEVYRSMEGAKILLDNGCKLFYVDEADNKVYSATFLGVKEELVCQDVTHTDCRKTLRVEQDPDEFKYGAHFPHYDESLYNAHTEPFVDKTPFLFQRYMLLVGNEDQKSIWNFGPWKFFMPPYMHVSEPVQIQPSVMDVFNILDQAKLNAIWFQYKGYDFLYCGEGMVYFVPKGATPVKTIHYFVHPTQIHKFVANHEFGLATQTTIRNLMEKTSSHIVSPN